MKPTIEPTISSVTISVRARDAVTIALCTSNSTSIAVDNRPAKRTALPRNSGATIAVTSTTSNSSAPGIVIGERHVSAPGSIHTNAANASSAARTIASTVVTFIPATATPGRTRSNGDATATASTLAVRTDEPAEVRANVAGGVNTTASDID